MLSTIFLISIGLFIGWNTTQPEWIGRAGRALATAIANQLSKK